MVPEEDYRSLQPNTNCASHVDDLCLLRRREDHRPIRGPSLLIGLKLLRLALGSNNLDCGDNPHLNDSTIRTNAYVYADLTLEVL